METAQLSEHPIFSSNDIAGGVNNSSSVHASGRRRRTIMVLRGSDLIVAVGKELRITSLADTASSSSSAKAYKVLHAPNVDFEIEQLAINLEGKFLVVAGLTQVAVVILPRPAYVRLVTARVDCKSMQVGQYFHASVGAPVIAKVDWHPWAAGGTGLLVMTSDGALREYDASSQVEEPLRTIAFLPPRTHRRGFQPDRNAAEVASFCFGQGKADWGPFTVYALTKSGDIYAMCPFLPADAHIPQSYLSSLECFVKTKRDVFVSSEKPPSSSHTTEEVMVDRQFKFIHALIKQTTSRQPATASRSVPDGPSRIVHVRRPETGIASQTPVRQGPFLLTPAPDEPEDGIGEDASDIVYIMSSSNDQQLDTAPTDEYPEESRNELRRREENLGVVLVAHGSGMVDVCLDTDKIHALWDDSHSADADPILPSFTVYETIDLGLTSQAEGAGAGALLNVNAPLFCVHPLQHSTLFVSHAFGIHSLDLGPWSSLLTDTMLHDSATEKRARRIWADVIEQAPETEATCLIDTFSPEHRASAPIVALALINNPYYSNILLALTNSLQPIPIDLSLQTPLVEEDPVSSVVAIPESEAVGVALPEPYVSLTSSQTYRMPALNLSRSLLRHDPANRYQTPETLRTLGRHSELTQSKAHELVANLDQVKSRLVVQQNEFMRQVKTLQELKKRVDELTGQEQKMLADRVKEKVVEQRLLLERLDVILRKYRESDTSPLTPAEEEWRIELRRLNDEVIDMKNRTALVQHRYEMVRREKTPVASTETKTLPTLGARQRESIENRLWAEWVIHHWHQDHEFYLGRAIAN
ncbi:hypothetical protein FRB97_009785 [Tulasnella sp. 331]|nr:hypothetical protein FRB97_009785 [Tulasnella sp. 331]